MTTPAGRHDLTVEQGVDSGPPVDGAEGAPVGHGNGELLAAGGEDHGGPGQELSEGEG